MPVECVWLMAGLSVPWGWVGLHTAQVKPAITTHTLGALLHGSMDLHLMY